MHIEFHQSGSAHANSLCGNLLRAENEEGAMARETNNPSRRKDYELITTRHQDGKQLMKRPPLTSLIQCNVGETFSCNNF